METPSTEPDSKRRKITSSSNCDHSLVRYGICCNCRSTVDKQYGRSFDYLVDGLQLSHKAVSLTKSLTTDLACLYEKKLHLVLDLDHTLLHTIHVLHLSKEEGYLLSESELREDLWRINSDFLVKLRPFLHEFLKEASELFTMYVYTMGNREYAKEVLKLIDPYKVYFGGRVVTREDSGFNAKTLDLVLAHECGVVIVDDTPQVWSDEHKRNLLQITKYNFFRENNQGTMYQLKSYAEEKRDENWNNGSLANVLKVLKEVHQRFFSGGMLDDVRDMLQDCLTICEYI